MAWLKLEKSAGVSYAEAHLVSDDTNSDGLYRLFMGMKIQNRNSLLRGTVVGVTVDLTRLQTGIIIFFNSVTGFTKFW